MEIYQIRVPKQLNPSPEREDDNEQGAVTHPLITDYETAVQVFYGRVTDCSVWHRDARGRWTIVCYRLDGEIYIGDHLLDEMEDEL